MQHDVIHFHGSYRYADRAALERALIQARAEIDDDEVERERCWMRCFVSQGTTLTVNLSVPVAADHRFLAANVFLILAHGAVDGAVEARHRDRQLDLYASGAED
ncbi:MAG: hypothetical protein H0X17_17155 [Deltaproteobacteria bacterium]|nr:hypothetical protein [Deltaproteobacteria bacterium]